MNSGVAICALQYSMPPGIQLNPSIGFFVLHLLAAKGELGAKPSESVTVKSQWGISQDTLKNLSFCRNRKLRSLYAMQTVCTHYGFVMGIFCSWEHEAGCIPAVLR